MAWDKNQPANNIKFRLVPSNIRTHWAAIENGEVPYVTLMLAKQAVAPSRADDSGFLYTKNVGYDNQLFYIDDAGSPSERQLTGIHPGTTTVPGSYTIYGITTPWGMVMNWGTVTTPAAGPTTYVDVTFQVAYTATPIVTSGQNGSSADAITNVTTTSFRIGSGYSRTIYFFAIGV